MLPRLDPPEAEFRTRSAEFVKQFEDHVVASALVILSTGAAAAIVRAFLAAYSLLVHQKRPQQSFRQIAPAVKWLQELPEQLPEVKAMTGLAEAIEAFAVPKV